MTEETHQKVKATHLKRNAYLYIRQSTLRQVIENSTGAGMLRSICRASFSFSHLAAGFRCELDFQLVLTRRI